MKFSNIKQFPNHFKNLLQKDFRMAEKRKIIFGIPLAVILLSVIMMIIFRFTLGSAFNLGTDFTGGYSVDIKLGDKLTDSNYRTYYSKIEDVLSSVQDESGNTYKITISGALQRQGSGSDSSIRVKYAAVLGVSENDMTNNVNPAIISALEQKVLNKVPDVVINGNVITATYNEVINDTGDDSPFKTLRAAFINAVADLNNNYSANITVDERSILLNADSHNKQIVITSSTDIANSQGLHTAVVSALNMPDKMSGSVSGGDMVGATVSTELIFNAVLAVALALIFMLCYIGLRFQLSSGLACILALFHDVLIMIAFMAICHIEINSTFIAALITILGYSINNSIIIFDRVRENMHSVFSKNMTPEAVANKSVGDTLMRSINTTITTLIMIVMVALIGVSDIRIFAFPIIIGLIAGTFSSIFIAPSLWALFQRIGKNRDNFKFNQKTKTSLTKKSAKATESNV